MRILLVEDDALIAKAVIENLTHASHAVDSVDNGADAVDMAFDVDYDCILLDLGLPKLDGISVLTTWRKRKLKTPVIILTARDDIDERVLGLDKGADDYLVKPFDMEELLARIRAVTRRSNSTNVVESVLTNGIISLNQTTHDVTITKDGVSQNYSLTAREFALLEALMIRPGAVLSREALEQRIYSWDDEIESNAVEYIIHTIRKKLGNDVIKNVRGVGWKVLKAN